MFIMPVVFGRFENSLRGQFETSLRGQDSPRPDKKLHKGCSGHLHGHGVKKERPSRAPVITKDCWQSLNDGSSSDESNHPRTQRSQSSEYTRLLTPVARRSTSSNSAVAQRLFTSPTKAVTAKYRAERTASDGVKMASDVRAINSKFNSNSLPRRRKANRSEEDSGNFSSSEENTDHLTVVDLVTPTPVKQNLIHGTSDDELSIQELRRKQRQERRDYLHLKNAGGSRRESPSPVKRDHLNSNETRGSRRSSDDASDSSYSPPASPLMAFRSSSNKVWQRSPISNGKPRARSSGTGSGTNSCAYAFGSSTKRFADDKKGKPLPHPFHKSSSDGVQNGLKAAELALRRTYSDPRQREKQEITKAWLKFKEDIEAAMQKKPNSGYYKNLADMMTTKMEMLADEVGNPFSICPGSGFTENFLSNAIQNLKAPRFQPTARTSEKDVWFAILALG